MVAYIDRLTLALMADNIAGDLGLSDTQIGLLIGLAFALFYAFCGLPLARAADRTNRKLLIIAGIAIWALMTALSAAADSFTFLLFTRMGVGLGEAVLTPAALSLISARFEAHERSLPISVFSSGGIIGVSAAYAAGGFVIPFAEDFAASSGIGMAGWQLTFLLISLPAFVCILLILPVQEPARNLNETTAEAGPLFDFKTLFEDWRIYAGILLGPAIAMAYVFASLSWVPIMMLRTHGWSTERTGSALGGAFLVAGFIAPLVATYMIKFLARGGQKHATLRAIVVLLCLSAPFGILVPSANSPALSVAAFGLFAVFGVATTMAPQVALQLVAPVHFRAQAAALWVLFTNLFGLGLGPTIVAVMSDALADDGSRIDDALFYLACSVYPLALLMIGLFYKHVRTHMNAQS